MQADQPNFERDVQMDESQQGYIYVPLAENNNCLSCFDLNGIEEARRSLITKIDSSDSNSVVKCLFPAICYALRNSEICSHLPEQDIDTSDALKRIEGGIESFNSVQDIELLKKFVDYSVSAKNVKDGFLHPGVLQAFAHVKSLKLFTWRKGDNGVLIPNKGLYHDYHEYAGRNAEKRVDLVFDDENKFELIRYQGFENEWPEVDELVFPVEGAPDSISLFYWKSRGLIDRLLFSRNDHISMSFNKNKASDLSPERYLYASFYPYGSFIIGFENYRSDSKLSDMDRIKPYVDIYYLTPEDSSSSSLDSSTNWTIKFHDCFSQQAKVLSTEESNSIALVLKKDDVSKYLNASWENRKYNKKHIIPRSVELIERPESLKEAFFEDYERRLSIDVCTYFSPEYKSISDIEEYCRSHAQVRTYILFCFVESSGSSANWFYVNWGVYYKAGEGQQNHQIPLDNITGLTKFLRKSGCKISLLASLTQLPCPCASKEIDSIQLDLPSLKKIFLGYHLKHARGIGRVIEEDKWTYLQPTPIHKHTVNISSLKMACAESYYKKTILRQMKRGGLSWKLLSVYRSSSNTAVRVEFSCAGIVFHLMMLGGAEDLIYGLLIRKKYAYKLTGEKISEEDKVDIKCGAKVLVRRMGNEGACLSFFDAALQDVQEVNLNPHIAKDAKLLELLKSPKFRNLGTYFDRDLKLTVNHAISDHGGITPGALSRMKHPRIYRLFSSHLTAIYLLPFADPIVHLIHAGDYSLVQIYFLVVINASFAAIPLYVAYYIFCVNPGLVAFPQTFPWISFPAILFLQAAIFCIGAVGNGGFNPIVNKSIDTFYYLGMLLFAISTIEWSCFKIFNLSSKFFLKVAGVVDFYSGLDFIIRPASVFRLGEYLKKYAELHPSTLQTLVFLLNVIFFAIFASSIVGSFFYRLLHSWLDENIPLVKVEWWNIVISGFSNLVCGTVLTCCCRDDATIGRFLVQVGTINLEEAKVIKSIKSIQSEIFNKWHHPGRVALMNWLMNSFAFIFWTLAPFSSLKKGAKDDIETKHIPCSFILGAWAGLSVYGSGLIIERAHKSLVDSWRSRHIHRKTLELNGPEGRGMTHIRKNQMLA